MVLNGIFKDNNNDNVRVRITSQKTGENISVGSNGLFFGGNPVTISYNIDDTFEHIIRKTATINFVTNYYLGDKLFANNAKDVSVRVQKAGTTIFDGHVDPNTFNQPFIAGLGEFSINCLDRLSVLQYYNYKEATIKNYDTLKKESGIRTFKDILIEILGINILYDGSKTISSNKNIFEETSINDLIMFGDDFDSVWTQEDVINYIMQYFNLHIIQEGTWYYIFDWQTIKDKNTNWIIISDNRQVIEDINEWNITTEAKNDNDITFADSDTNISIADVYNQISVECPLEAQDALFVSPLEKDNLSSLYSGKQLYCTEYIAEGSGDDAYKAINKIIKNEATDWKDAKVYNHYMQLMTNPNWKLYINGTDTIDTLYEQDSNGKYINQWKVTKYLVDNQCIPALIRMGEVEIKGSQVQDNSPVSKIDMNDYLFISVNGNETDTADGQSPSPSTLQTHSPLIEYVGETSGGIYSPVDDDTINYLVFSGEILLQPIAYESSNNYANRNNNYAINVANGVNETKGHDAVVPYYNVNNIPPIFQSNLIRSDHNTEGRYYTRKFWTVTNPSDKPNSYLSDGSCLVNPWTDDKSAKGYEYRYSAEGEGSDYFSKIPIFACELTIGDKRLIETNIDEYGDSTFEWVTIGQEPTKTVDGVTYAITTFSLGVNPKIKDYVIGQEYKIQNTIDYTMNLDAEGTAIPIKKSDNLSGKVTFKIVGLINSSWDDIVRTHPTWFRHTSWSTNTKSILAHTQNIIIKDFECKIYSSNSVNDNEGDDTLVYVSAETDKYINSKDFEFKFITQPSSKECLEMGCKSSVNTNAVINANTNEYLQEITYNGETAKAEEHYINQYYNEYSTPKIILETTLHDILDAESPLALFHWNVLNKNFIVLGKEQDVKFNRITLKLKEV